jgi:hypothetical protein
LGKQPVLLKEEAKWNFKQKIQSRNKNGLEKPRLVRENNLYY